MSNRSFINLPHSSLIPFPSFPITISPLLLNECEYMFSPSRNVPYMGVLPFSSVISCGRLV